MMGVPMGWMMVIAKNKAKDFWRKNKNSSVPFDEELDERLHVPLDREESLESCVSNGITEFQKQEGPDRAAVLAWKISGVSLQDISKRLNRSYDATRQFVSQTYKKFKPFVMHCRQIISD